MGNGGIGVFLGAPDPSANLVTDNLHKQIIQQYYDQVYHATTVAAAQAAVANFVTPGIKVHRDGEIRTGVVALGQSVVATLADFPDLHIDIREMVAAGTRVAYRINVTYRDPAFPVGTPRNRLVRGIIITRFVNQRMAESWVQYEPTQNFP
jgi:predicted ester cyclase